jgi:hypothetical protein
VDRDAAQELRASIKSLRDEIAGLQEEVRFYKSLMSPSSLERGLQIAEFEVTPTGVERQYSYHILLTQVESRRDWIQGELQLSVTDEKREQVLSLTELAELDNAFREAVAATDKSYLGFSHPVYQYFQEAYGLEGQSLHWEPDTPLNHDMLHEIGHLKRDHNFQYLIWESEPLPESIEKLAGEGIQSAVIDPKGGMPESGDFMDGMRQNLEVLQQALGVQP